MCEWQLVGIIWSECGLFWVRGCGWGIIFGGWGCMGYYFGWVGVCGGESEWMRHYFGWVGGGKISWVGGDECGWVHCLTMPLEICQE